MVLDLVVGDAGLTPRALIDGALALFDEVALVGLLEAPPGGLHVLGVDRLVGVVPVHPDAEVLKVRLEAFELLLGEVFALLDEVLLAELLDVLLVLEVEALLDFRLDGEAVHVIARPVSDVVALHPQVADVTVLQGLVPRRPHVGRAGGVWRPVNEEVILAVSPMGLRLLVGVDVVPVLEDAVLDGVGVVLVVDSGETFHTRSIRRRQ